MTTVRQYCAPLIAKALQRKDLYEIKFWTNHALYENWGVEIHLLLIELCGERHVQPNRMVTYCARINLIRRIPNGVGRIAATHELARTILGPSS